MTFGSLVSPGAYRFIKRSLLATPGLGRMAAGVKSRAATNSYLSLRESYEKRAVAGSAASLYLARVGSRIDRLREREGLWRILFVGADKQQDESGFIQALGRLGQLTLFEQDDGRYGILPDGGRWSDGHVEAISSRLLELATGCEQPYDIVIGQMWDGWLDSRVLSKIREETGAVVVNIAMDDRHVFDGSFCPGLATFPSTLGLIPHIDLALTAAPEAVQWYLKEGVASLYFPEASDPELFKPDQDLAKSCDVSFVGAAYGIRRRVVMALRAAGITVEAYGDGWENGRIATEDVPGLFASSRIILGVGTIGQTSDFLALKLRDFDATMSGSCYLTHDNPDFGALFSVGTELEVYSDSSELVAKAKLLLADDALRESIGAAGRERCLRDHTWDGRLSMLKDFLIDPAEGVAAPEIEYLPFLKAGRG